jgi:hypothetical protein
MVPVLTGGPKTSERQYKKGILTMSAKESRKTLHCSLFYYPYIFDIPVIKS